MVTHGAAPLDQPPTVVAMGLEINAGHLSCRLVAPDGTIVYEHHETGHFAHSRPTEALEQLAGLARAGLRQLPPSSRLVSIGMALPGIVSHGGNVLLRAPNLDWHNLSMREAMTEAGLPEVGTVSFTIANGADFAAVAAIYEAPGRRRGLDSFLFVAGEAGIGSSAVVRGEVLQGAHGWSGEIGHMCIDRDGPLCGCGAMGCLESIAGPAAILRHTGFEEWTDLLAAMETPKVQEALRRAGRALGIGLANALNLLDLSVVVVTGHLADVAHVTIPTIQRELTRRVLSAPFDPPRVLTPNLGPYPATLGAAYAGLNAAAAQR